MTSTRALLVAAALGAVDAGCSCNAPQTADAGSDAVDAGSDALDAGSDALDAGALMDTWVRVDWGGADDGVCRPGPGLCQDDSDCVSWGAAVAPSGTFVSSMCAGYRCTLGVVHCFTHDGMTTCNCSSPVGLPDNACLGDEICLSDTPGGPTRCVQECQGR